jgi:glutaredoxin
MHDDQPVTPHPLRRRLAAATVLIATGLIALPAGAYLGGWLAGQRAPRVVQTVDNSRWLEAAGERVVLFTTSTCPHCQRTLQWLDARQVRHVNLVIDGSDEAMQQYLALGVEAVPVVMIGDQRIIGFHEQAFVDALRRAGIALAGP